MIWSMKVEPSFVAWSAARSGLETPLKFLKSFKIMISIVKPELGARKKVGNSMKAFFLLFVHLVILL